MKKLLILTLASVFAAVMLAGCSKDDTSSLVVDTRMRNTAERPYP